MKVRFLRYPKPPARLFCNVPSSDTMSEYVPNMHPYIKWQANLCGLQLGAQRIQNCPKTAHLVSIHALNEIAVLVSCGILRPLLEYSKMSYYQRQ